MVLFFREETELEAAEKRLASDKTLTGYKTFVGWCSEPNAPKCDDFSVKTVIGEFGWGKNSASFNMASPNATSFQTSMAAADFFIGADLETVSSCVDQDCIKLPERADGVAIWMKNCPVLI